MGDDGKPVEVFTCRDGSSVRIRNGLRPGDLGAVVRQHGILYSRECGFDHTIEIYVARPLSDFAEKPGESQRLWIVEREGEFAGSVAIVAHSPGEAQLRWLLLDPSVRGRGIGRHLVSKALAFARQAGYRSVFLWTVHILPAAAHIYRSAGFTVTEENAVVQWGMSLREQRYEILFEGAATAPGKGRDAMITIGSYVHRSLLCDIIRRWMFGDLRPTDGDQVTRLVHFNNVYVSRYLGIFSRWVLEALHGAGVESRPVALKGELKDALIENPPYRNARVDELIRDYRDSPGRYYRETPFYGTLYFRDPGEGPHCLGASRIKRIRRLAEKAARRIIDQIFMNIREHAEALAEERARFMGVSRSHLVSSQEEMIAEFLRAEERFLDDLRNRRALSGMGPLVINDVAGLKIILERESQEKLKEILLSRDACDIVEEETHKGNYNATNYIVRFVPPREEIVSVPLGDRILRILSHRGWSGEAAAEEFREFILTGERSVYLEIIVSTYQETLESEIGRSIHEDRIVAQRLSRPYRGHLAVNVEYLMEYLFFFPFSRQAEINELPIRLWYRYLPDYFDEVVKEMFQIPLTGALD